MTSDVDVLPTPEAGPADHGDLLAVKDLSVEFRTKQGWVRVLDDVSFGVGRGEVLGLVGESGSGKSVSCLSIVRLLPRNARVCAGEALLDGTDLLSLTPREVRAMRGPGVAMIFQDALHCLNPAFTVGDQIAEAFRAHGRISRKDARVRAREMLELVEIPRAEQRLADYPHRFSGGMCQRVQIAMALACNPKLLIADEPTTALDVTVQAQILQLIRSLQAELRLSVVFITHDLGVVADLCDRVAVMYAGQVVEVGDRDEVFFRPSHPYTAGLLGSIPKPGSTAARTFDFIPGLVPVAGGWPGGCHFHPRCGHCEPGRCDAGPVELAAGRVEGSLVRCVRSDELSLEGVEP